MNKTILTVLLALSIPGIAPLHAEEIKTFSFEGIGGSITVTQDIPSYFIGNYESIFPELQPGKMLLNKGRNLVSYHWWNKESKTKKITWGVIVKNGKIDIENVMPPNPAYKPYDRMKLIIRYEDENMSLVSWGLYRAESEKYGTRIVAGRYIKKTEK